MSVHGGPLAAGFSSSDDLRRFGLVRIALAGAAPATGQGVLATVTYRLAQAEDAGLQLAWVRGDVNEGGVPSQLLVEVGDGNLLYLPLMLR